MPRINTGLKEKDFQDRKMVKTDIDGKSIVIGMTSGKLYAMDSVCSHEGGPLEDGSLDGYNLTCPWHQGIFDIRNAKASPETSWVTDLKSYAVVVDEKGAEIKETYYITREEKDSSHLYENADFSPKALKDSIKQGELKTTRILDEVAKSK